MMALVLNLKTKNTWLMTVSMRCKITTKKNQSEFWDLPQRPPCQTTKCDVSHAFTARETMAIFVPNLCGSTKDFRTLNLSAFTAKRDFPELVHFFLGGGGGGGALGRNQGSLITGTVNLVYRRDYAK